MHVKVYMSVCGEVCLLTFVGELAHYFSWL